MTPPALDLLARAIAEQVATSECGRCSARLAGARVGVSILDDGRVGAEIECASCGHRSIVGVGPADADGVARLR